MNSLRESMWLRSGSGSEATGRRTAPSATSFLLCLTCAAKAGGGWKEKMRHR